MAQLAENMTLDFGGDQDLMVMELSPASGSALGMESAWDALSLPLPSPLTLALSHKRKKIPS